MTSVVQPLKEAGVALAEATKKVEEASSILSLGGG